ncbi:MAG: hypothetical protein P1U56_09040, partial [Saprospiraceae bacterium]|nr:hypothetical protein [Saprospiraceae bacterium]
MIRILSITILLSILFSNACLSQCPSDFLTISSQTELDSFKVKYPDCTNFDADLYLQFDVESLAALNELESIKSLTLRWCFGLEEAYINDEIEIGALSIFECDNLVSAPIINNLASNGDLTLGNLPLINPEDKYSLQAINNFSASILPFDIFNNFEELEEINGSVYLSGNDQLTDISVLDQFDITSITLVSNPLLNSCNIETVCNMIEMNNGNVIISNNG